MGESLTVHVVTDKTFTDLATNLLYGGKHRFHMSNLLYEIYDYL